MRVVLSQCGLVGVAALDTLRTRVANWRDLASRFFVFAAAAAGVWYAVGTLALGATGMDFSHSLLRAFAAMHHLAPGQAFWQVFGADASARGVVSPLRVLPLAIWLLQPDERIIRVLQLALVGANVATFAWVCRRVEGSGYAAVAAAVLLLSFQLRKFHDPITGDAFVMPLTAEFVLLALASLFAFVRTPRAAAAVSACVWAVLASLMDPTGVAAAFSMALVSALVLRGLTRALMAAAFAVAGFCGLLPTFAAGWHMSSASLAHSLPQQIIAAIPASYRVLAGLVPDKIVAFAYDIRFDVIPQAGALDTIIALLVALGAGAGLYAMLRTRGASYSSSLAVLGLTLWIAASVASIPPHAHALPWGDAFNGVYIESFGFALFAASALRWLVRFNAGDAGVAGALCVLIAFAVFGMLYGNVRFDKLVIAKEQAPLTWRYVLSRAAAAGTFKAVPEGATVSVPDKAFAQYGLAQRGGYANTATFLYSLTGRAYNVVAENGSRGRDAGDWLLNTSVTPGLHTVTLAQIQSARGRALSSSRAVAYVSAFSPQALSAQPLAQPSIAGVQKQVRTVGTRSLVADVRRTCGAVAISDIVKPDKPAVSFGPGFQTRFPDPDVRLVAAVPLSVDDKNWRYGTRDATLVVIPGRCAAKTIALDTDVYTRSPGVLSMTFDGKHQQLPISQAGAHVHLTLPAVRRSMVRLSTTSPALDADMRIPRYEYGDRGLAYMLVVHPVVAAENK